MITETQRLKIRELTVNDAAFVLRLTNEPSFMANIGDKGIRNLDDAKEFILKGSWTNQKKPGYGQFLVQLKENNAAAGICGLLYRDTLDVTDIGFAFLPDYWGCGYAIESAKALMEYAHTKLGVDTIVGLTIKENVPSIKVLEKLGMKFKKMVKMSDDDPGTALYG